MKAIWAEDANGGIGANNKLLWNLPSDLKNFKLLTEGSPIVMGRATWDSLPFKPLPNRENVVLTRNLESLGNEFKGIAVTSVNEILSRFPDAWVIGGGQIYSLLMPYIGEVRRTVVEHEYAEADTFAPSLLDDFSLVSDTVTHMNENGLQFRFETWLRLS